MALSKPYLGIHIFILKIKEISRRKKKCEYPWHSGTLHSLLSKHSLYPGAEPILTQMDPCYKDHLWQTPNCGLPAPYFFSWNTRQKLLQLSQKHNIYLFPFCFKVQSEINFFSISNLKQLSTRRFTRAASFALKILSCGDLPALWNS